MLVPRRDDGGWRDKVWDYCRARWEKHFPEFPIYEGHHNDGPFNRAKAVNAAAALADEDGQWDFAIVIDSDVMVKRSLLDSALALAEDTGRVTWAHRRWRGVNEYWTGRLVADRTDLGLEVDGTDIDVLVERTNPISWSCCIVIPRAAWDVLGGFDERFVGWGFEDMAFQSAVCGLLGWERIEGDVYHLWHPRVSGSGKASKDGSEYSREAVSNARLGRRYMVALRRDYRLHDRYVATGDGPVSEEERQRDIDNLKRDDAKLATLAERYSMPDWSEWWPTLEELVDGAKQARQAGTSITLVVHTDGRREYIEKSIPSLLANVSGDIQKQVIYDDSGDPEYRDWLNEMFGPMGFYVVGPLERLGYTGSMAAMYRYLNTRCTTEYVFAVEDDFVYNEPVDLDEMAEVLRTHGDIQQMALLRAPAYQSEIDKGGILGWPVEDFIRVSMNGYSWMEHRLFWTANPSLFRRSLTARPWPKVKSSERVFGDEILQNSRARFAFWGTGDAMIEHIGLIRAGTDY